MRPKLATFSLAWNFDPKLIDGIERLNSKHGDRRRITEVYAALPDAPVPSARPSCRIPTTSWREFRRQVTRLADIGVAFNYLLNTNVELNRKLEQAIKAYLERLWQAGVRRLTLGSPDLVSLLRSMEPRLHLTLSITYGTRRDSDVRRAALSGADAVYLDGVWVNRDFELLRRLVKCAPIECRLYANLSCISHCPVVREHYALFADQRNPEMAAVNDAFFGGCSMVKCVNPVEWIQTPWIRPEDIGVYVEEGIWHFKLSDRLADTCVLLRIAGCYLHAQSPDDLFLIVERDGAKYSNLEGLHTRSPMKVNSARIPAGFIEHFRKGGCSSRNLRCAYCSAVAAAAIESRGHAAGVRVTDPLVKLVPPQLLARASQASRLATGLHTKAAGR